MCPQLRFPGYLIIVLLGVTISIMIFILIINNNDIERPYALASLESEFPERPIIYDSSLKAELIFQREVDREGGTLSPVSSMTFLNNDDILI